MFSTAKPHRLGRVQQRFVAARAVSDDVLVVAAGSGRFAYVGVVEIGGITYDLKSTEEQAQLNDQFQSLLCGLTFPVQLIWRSYPMRLDPYVRRFQVRPEERTSLWGNWPRPMSSS